MGTATEQSLRNILTELESDTLPTNAATQTTLAAILAELLAKLETADLNIDPVTGYLDVLVQGSALPTDAATQTTLAAILALIGALTSPAAGTVNKQLADILTELGAKLETADLNLDATKDLQVDVKTVPTTTVLSQGGDKIFAFESIVEEAVLDSALAAGTNTLNGTAVPTGKVWQVTQAGVQYVGTAPTRLEIRAFGLATALEVLDQATPLASHWYVWSGTIYLQAGDYMMARVETATATDDLYLRYAGVQMDAPS